MLMLSAFAHNSQSLLSGQRTRQNSWPGLRAHGQPTTQEGRGGLRPPAQKSYSLTNHTSLLPPPEHSSWHGEGQFLKMSMKPASAASVCSVTILPKLEIQVYNKQISRKKFIGCSCWGENTSLTRQIQQVLRHHLLDVKFYFRHRQQTEWRRIRDILYNRNGCHTGEHGRILTAALISYIYNSRRARSGR